MKKLKWKIKFKVKHLLIIIFSVFVVVPNLIIAVADTLYNLGSGNNIPKSYYMQGALNLYVKMPKLSPFEDKAYYIMAKNSYTYNKSTYVGFSSGGSYIHEGANYIGEKAIYEAIKYHNEAISEKSDSKYYWKNTFSLVNLYYINGEVEKAFSKLEEIKKSDNEFAVSTAYFNEGVLNLKLKQYDKAIKAFENIDESKFPLKNKHLADAYILKGDHKKANEYYAKGTGEVNNVSTIKKLNEYKIYDDIDYLDIDNQELPYWSANEKVMSKVKENYYNNIILDEFRGSIKGNLNLSGVNMEGSIIVLTSRHIGISIENETMMFGEIKNFSYVGKDGSFEFNNIPEDEYYIALMIPKQKYLEAGLRRENFNTTKVKVKRGETIQLNLDKSLFESQSYEEGEILKYKSYLEDNKIVLKEDKNGEIEISNYDFKNLRVKPGEDIKFYNLFFDCVNNSFEYEYEKRSDKESYKKQSDKENYNNYTYYNYYGDYYYLDNGFRNDDNPIVTYPKVINEYMQANKYDKVLEYYEKEYQKDNKNEFAIQMLIKLYTTGTDELGDNKDVNKAIKLADKLYQINNDENLDMQVREFILDKYQISYYYN